MAKKFMLIICLSLIGLFVFLFAFFYYNSMNHAETTLHNQALSLAEQLSNEGTFIQLHTNKIRLTGVDDGLSDEVQVNLGQVGVPGIVRNPNHEPDAFEQKAIEKFLSDDPPPSEQGIVNVKGGSVYRYVEPLYIQPSCIGCHGGRKGDTDPFGYTMEGLEVGDLKGAITVTVPADHVLEGVVANTKTLVTGGVVIIVILLAVIYASVTKTIVNPVKKIAARVQNISDGDLTGENELKYKNDEIGQLSRAADEMKDRLREIIYKVQESAEMVTASSQELTSNSDETSIAAREISKQISEVSVGSVAQSNQSDTLTEAMDTIANHFRGVSEKTCNAKSLSHITEEEATKGKARVEETIYQIHVIKDTVQDLAAVIKQLSERSIQINSIVRVISDISEQTNLLALNAAIEAARAGEHGRGFSVVADEVRKLAEQSANSAKNVTDLITKIQEDTDLVVKKMEIGYGEVEKGKEVATSAGESFEEILQSIVNVVKEIDVVTEGTEEISHNTITIFKNIEEVRNIAHEVAETSQDVKTKAALQDDALGQIQQASRQLAELSEELLNTVQSFKL